MTLGIPAVPVPAGSLVEDPALYVSSPQGLSIEDPALYTNIPVRRVLYKRPCEDENHHQ